MRVDSVQFESWVQPRWDCWFLLCPLDHKAFFIQKLKVSKIKDKAHLSSSRKTQTWACSSRPFALLKLREDLSDWTGVVHYRLTCRTKLKKHSQKHPCSSNDKGEEHHNTKGQKFRVMRATLNISCRCKLLYSHLATKLFFFNTLHQNVTFDITKKIRVFLRQQLS